MLRVSVVDELGRPTRAPGLARWLTRAAPARARGQVAIALVSTARIRALNRQYRRKDSATDVLAFPAGPGDPRGPRARPRSKAPWQPLGDIVIARGVAVRQAREHGHPLGTELRILALHGLLHLLGYDHEVDSGQMGRLERRLRRKGGLRHGLTEREKAPAAGARRRSPQRARLRVGVAHRRAVRPGLAAKRRAIKQRRTAER